MNLQVEANPLLLLGGRQELKAVDPRFEVQGGGSGFRAWALRHPTRHDHYPYL